MGFAQELGLLVLVGLVAGVTAVLATWYTWNNQIVNNPLPDVLFDILPDLSDITIPIPNYIYLAQFIVAILSFQNEKKLQLVVQYIFLQSVLTTIRAITVSVTILPNIHLYEYCKKEPGDFFEVFTNIIEHGTCGDYMWSGHTASSFILYMFVHRHKSNYFFELLVGLLFGGMILFLILQRWHYTVDIIIAVIVTWLTFQFYKQFENDTSPWYFSSFKWSNLCSKCRRTRELEAEQPGYYTPMI